MSNFADFMLGEERVHVLWSETMRGYVREATATLVEERSEIGQCVFANVVFQIIRYSSCLILWLCEVVAEAS